MFKDIDDLLRTELRHKPDQESIILMQDRNTKDLENMFETHLLLYRCRYHSM